LLLGRCCHASIVLQQCWHSGVQTQGPEADNQHVQWTMYRQDLAKNLLQLQSTLVAVAQWLAAASTVQQLSVLGYQTQDLQQQLAQAAGALQPLCNQLDAADPSAAPAALMAAQEQLLCAAGSVLACFAVPHACNNPTQAAGTCLDPQRLSWWVAAPASVLAAAQPATAGGPASVRHGASTSQCARRWQQR
jgi:hypothetical protein